MKNLILLMLLVVALGANAQTQADMNREAYAQYQKSDQELNSVYKQILAQYKTDTTFIANLKASQRLWVSFRDAELKMKFPDRKPGHYGSIHAICRANYLEELTRDRTAKLREWLKEAEEGDACAGSMKSKD
ncbi:lysozyme inhibitor LprI family protein [Rufibacter roseus]|uniref:Lysozyme inhibitor LprI family protein n=1 Tax=Rufibacter roseus TaxID=1567108 RepID=A0ABW2DJT3_9BACT|nr:lysozyme inhibitor LprI family protein [Rufibacter roseus]